MNRACTNDGCACTPNASIKCTVTNCAHHCKDVDNCGLTAIQVGTHESRPTRTSAPTARATRSASKPRARMGAYIEEAAQCRQRQNMPCPARRQGW